MFPSEIWRKSRERIVSRCRPRFLIICHPRRNRGTHRQTRLITAFIFVPRLATIRDPSRRFRFDLVEDYHSSRGPPPCIETICKTRENARRTKPWKECRGVEKEEEEEVNLSTGGGFRLEISRGALWLFGSISGLYGSWTRDRPCFLFILDRVRPTPRRS